MIPLSVFATGVNPMVATIIPKIVPEIKLNILNIRALWKFRVPGTTSQTSTMSP